MADLTIGVDGRRAAAGSRVVVRSLADIRGAAGRTGKAVTGLNKRMQAASATAAVMRRALTGLGAGLAAREFIKLSDSFTNVQNRLKLVTDGSFELGAVQERLFKISQETRTSFEANATLFNRMALSAKDLGVSLEDVLQTTQSLNQAVILSGAATTEASQGLLQLSQGLASNRLSGDELRSVLEQLPVVADVIAKQLGVTRGELKFFGEQGKISAGVVFEAFRNAREELAGRFAETVPTVAQSFIILRNAAIRFVGNLNNSTGIVTALSKVIIKIAANFDDFAKGISVVAAALGPLVFGRAIAFAATALRGLTLLALANPFTALVAGLAALTAAAVAFGDEPLSETLEDDGNSFAKAALEALGLADAIRDGVLPAQTTLGDVTKAVLSTIIDNVKTTAQFYIDAWLRAVNKVLEFLGVTGKSWGDLLVIAKNVVNKTVGFFVGLANAVFVVFREIASLYMRGMSQLFEIIKGPIIAVVGFAKRALEFIGGIVAKIFGAVKTEAQEIIDDLGITGADITNLPIINDAIRIGSLAGDAFLEGLDKDYIGAVGDFFGPAFEQVIAKSGEITAKRLKDQADKLAGQAGVDLTDKTEGALIIRPEDARLLKKLIEANLTPLEKLNSRLAEIKRLRPFARTIEEITGLDRAIDDAKLDRISEEFKLIGLDDINTVLREAVKPLDQYNMAMTRLNELLVEGTINQTQFDAAVINAKDKILGLKDIYAEFTKEAARSIQSAFSDFLFDPFEEGLDGMIRGMAETLRKIAADILATQILKSFLSLVPGGNVIAAGLAEGGPAAGGKSYLVGEKGPEIFTPRSSGTVTPNGQTPAGAAPNVNVAGPTIVNTIDDGMIVAAFNRGGGGQVVLNNITENKAAYRNALGLG